MDKIYKVFVSSTFEDLREERAEVQKALLKAHCLPVGMELFPAADDETWDFIKTQIADSDYYVVLVAGKYGSLASDGKSYTEKEFDYALELGKPGIGFVHEKREELPRIRTEIDPDRSRKLEAFISKVKSKPVRPFVTPQQLAYEVSTSLYELKKRRPATGFVRADEIADPRKLAVIAEENLQLRKQLDELRSKHQLAGWLAEETTIVVIDRSAHPEKAHSISISWREIALLIAPEIAADRIEHYVLEALAFELLRRRNQIPENVQPWRCRMADNSVTDIRNKFTRAGFIAVSTEQRMLPTPGTSQPRPFDARIWKFTELGRTQLALLVNK